ncbi:MAG: M55 family metallopeptidase [Eubacteriales bacterium]|nr:M55 family metallopeptidase [Eubacteriales bacterium]
MLKTGKKYMIRCDMEGVSGVVSYEQAEPGKSEFDFGKKMFMSDLMSAVTGLNHGGAGEIVIYDDHFHGRNIDLDKLPANTSAICGKPPYTENWAGGLDNTFDGLILIGFHSKAGTPGALLNHTYEPDIREIKLNGISVGEIGIEAAIAGDYNVPLLMVTADSEGAAEAEKLIPGVRTVAVKASLCENGAICYSLELTSKMIYEAAGKIVTDPPEVRPYRAETGTRLEIVLNEGPYRSAYEELYPDSISGGTTTIIKSRTTEAWAEYWARKLKCAEVVEK